MFTHEQWRRLLDDSGIAPNTLIRVLRGQRVSGATARRLYKAAQRARVTIPDDFVIVGGVP